VLNVDADNVPITVSAGATPYTASVALPFASIPHELRHGRVRLLNANGSELLDLPLAMKTEYWKDATSGWQLNNADSCTTISAANFAFAFGGIGNNLIACKTAVSLSGAAPNFSVSLAKPSSGNSGWTDLTVNLGSLPAGNTCTAVGASGPLATTANAPWLQFNWTGAIGNPRARATFGVYKSGPVIHRRELY
jgi:MSHA biogenesis protein MshQ